MFKSRADQSYRRREITALYMKTLTLVILRSEALIFISFFFCDSQSVFYPEQTRHHDRKANWIGLNSNLIEDEKLQHFFRI